jgi:hypothetical protein
MFYAQAAQQILKPLPIGQVDGLANLKLLATQAD